MGAANNNLKGAKRLRLLGDRPREECGVFGLYAPLLDSARVTYFGLYALQHRGQESAGIATSDGEKISLERGLGLVSQVFNERKLKASAGPMAIGHTRYSTTGKPVLKNAQPYVLHDALGDLALAHNGNLTNTEALKSDFKTKGVRFETSSDSELILHAIGSQVQKSGDWVTRLRHFMTRAEGAYSLTLLTPDGVYGVRDPRGFRPLCLGEIEVEGETPQTQFVLASESCALDTIGARFVRDIDAGEIVHLGKEGVTSYKTDTLPRGAFCSFEYVYFARPDSKVEGHFVSHMRERFGEALAKESPVDADLVTGVPDSALPAAIGYARALGIPYNQGIVKNPYVGRTFIQPDDELRREKVRLKYMAQASMLKGKRVILVDDSVVRGNTARPLVQLIRDAGATEVHLRVSSPPVRHPCFMGVAFGTKEELIAHQKSVEEIRRFIGADSLAYLSEEAMLACASADKQKGFCTACFSGDYPISMVNK